MTERPIRFVHRGRIQALQGQPPTRSVLQWLREDAHCTGTKEGCAEGDCGACTVWVAELAHAGSPASTVVGELSVRPVNACIRLLPTLDGKALLTVEDLSAGSTLHPAQQAMVDCHGSQCGFCTPGFVMTLAHLHATHSQQGTQPSRDELADGLAGNLCRCTGYRPILQAGQRMFELPATALPTAAIAEQLRSLQADGPLQTTTSHGHYTAPRSVQELATELLARPKARLLGGATDIGLWVNKQFRPLPELIYTGEVAELKRIAQTEGELRIGCAVPLEDAFTALAAHWPEVREAWVRFAGPPVRHAGTLGGNVANGSPIGDGAPVLMALGAQLLLQRGALQRRVALEDFYLGYMQNALQPSEFVHSVLVPLPQAGWQLRAYKLSKRRDCDISTLFAAMALKLEQGRVVHARLAFGGMAATVKRAALAEAALQGQPWNEASLQRALAALAQDFQPMTDQRGSAAYRQASAAALLKRLWLETRPHEPLPASAVRLHGHEELAP